MVSQAGGRVRTICGALRPYTVTVARLRGVPIRLHPSLVLTCLAVGFVAARLSAPFVTGRLPAPALTVGATAVLLYCGSICLHELAHLLALRHYDVPVEYLSFSAWGGVTRAARRPETPGADFAVAAAGPACTFLLAMAGICLGCALIRVADAYLLSACAVLAGANLLMLPAALMPVWPTDGGYMLRAVAWKLSGNPAHATRFACYQSMALVGALFFTGVLSLVHPFLPGGPGVAVAVLTGALVISPNIRGAAATLRRMGLASRETARSRNSELPSPIATPTL